MANWKFYLASRGYRACVSLPFVSTRRAAKEAAAARAEAERQAARAEAAARLSLLQDLPGLAASSSSSRSHCR